MSGRRNTHGNTSDPVSGLLAQAPLFADLKNTFDTFNASLLDTTGATPAPTLRPGQDAPTHHQVFSSSTGDWVVEVDTFAGGSAGLRWMHTVTSAKVVPGFSLGLLRTNAAMDAQVTAAPAIDFEAGLFNQSSILLYLNMPPRIDLLVRPVYTVSEQPPRPQAEPDEEYYQRYYMQAPTDGVSYEALMTKIANDPTTTPFRSKSVHIRVYSATGALVMVQRLA